MVTAVKTLKRMRGGACSHLMLASDGTRWVVKFTNNPQHIRVLANEMIASSIATAVGLSVPQCALVCVPVTVIDESPELTIRDLAGREVKCEAGLHCGSRFIGSEGTEVQEVLSNDMLLRVTNLTEFCGVLCLDKWLANSDGRQAIFSRASSLEQHTAMFIDHGFCFTAGDWSFSDSTLRGVYHSVCVYERVDGWGSFEPWISRMEGFETSALWEIMKRVPEDWYNRDSVAAEVLIDSLDKRRVGIRGLINMFRRSGRTPFPHWS